MNQALNFQSIIMKLQEFWADQDCLIWQPYYSQVGAGTMNPATFLRVLGPEPWRVGYVEPSIRPDDGRYGENPNRMQMHYQFQVILKPDPGDPQEIYLRSLEAIGVNPRQHDIRFVEDNWQQPALGAWGLGWEVWLDGQEITQFTYFQQAGGIQLDPVSVEITYGLERIAIALQRAGSFRDIQWSPTLTDGDVNLQAEQEHSKYYFEVADVERLRGMYDLYEAEAQSCLEQGLVLPAYDYVLKCSHTFNVLDTRGAVGVTERQIFFGRTRDLSRRVTEAYLEQRQMLEFPWMDEQDSESSSVPSPLSPVPRSLTSPAPFLFEIGTEELPVGDLDHALTHLSEKVPALLEKLRLEHGEIRILGTPRRLVVFVEELSAHQTDVEKTAKGPPAQRAYDEDGRPTKAAVGFARSKGLDVNELQVQEMDGGRYVVATVREEGQSTGEVLSENLPELVSTLRFGKSMRWNISNVIFSRPIRWFLALHGESVIPFEYASVASGSTTRGLRFRDEGDFEISTPQDYFHKLTEQGIILDPNERRTEIQKQVEALAEGVGGAIPDDPVLLSEVANLVEAPTSLIGSFDPSHLALPREVLISVMKKHQRYFPVERNNAPGETLPQSTQVELKQAELLPKFIAVRNGDDQHLDIITNGNEHVIQARFADADFFVREDFQRSLESYLPRLDTLTFQLDLGSMLDKTQRIMALVKDLTAWLNLDGQEMANIERTAQLCKADLVTNMVVEMTSLQGIMGSYYALSSGEPEAVAVGISEHYLPRAAGGASPRTYPGLVVGMADRLDTLVGLFAVGLAPSGNRDPYAQRRAALGLVGNLVVWDKDFDLRPALNAAASHLPVTAGTDIQAAVLDFIVERLRNIQREVGERYDVVDAVLAAQGYNPARATKAVGELSAWVRRADWSDILPAYSRCVRITRDLDERHDVNEQSFIEEAEIDLYAALLAAERTERAAGSVDDFLNAFVPMIPAVNRFFDEVLVMVDEAALRQNRLGLLQRIVSLADDVVDMSKLEGF